MRNDLVVRGLTASSGTQWVSVTKGENTGYVELKRCVGTAPGVVEHLAQQNVLLFGKDSSSNLTSRVEELEDFPRSAIAENIGWNGDIFALPNGNIFPKSDSVPMPISFLPDTGKCAKKGTKKAWKAEVAGGLIGQKIPTFVLASAFMPPLLNFIDRSINIGFEIVGGPGIGKTTVQQLAASALGCPTRNSGHPYSITMNTTMNGLEQIMRDHRDHLIILDETNLFFGEASKAARAGAFQTLAFKLGSGSEKERYNTPSEGDGHRFGFLISSNEPLSDLIGENSDSAKAASDRILTIPVPTERPHGVFDQIPSGISGSQFASKLVAAAEENHGFAIERYLENLTKERRADEPALRAKIDKRMELFREESGVDRNDGSAVRVADAFGLVYAAGMLAKEYGVLPKKMKCLSSALHCYRLNRLHSVPSKPFIERLRGVVNSDGVIHRTKQTSADTLAMASIIVSAKSGYDEIILKSQAMRDHFPDWAVIQKSREVKTLLDRDGQHLKKKRTVGPNARSMRVLCFKLPRLDDD